MESGGWLSLESRRGNDGVESGDTLPRRGEIWWVRVDKRRPALVVQTDMVREPRVRSFLVVPLASRLHLEGLPGKSIGKFITGPTVSAFRFRSFGEAVTPH